MLKQYSISLKTHFHLRVTVFVLMILLNTIFAVCGLTGAYGNNGYITVTVFSILIFCTWIVVCILADYEIIKSLFTAPKGYYIFLVPVAGWKVLLGRLAAILTWDIPGFIAGIAGIVVQAFLQSDMPFSFKIENPVWVITFILMAILKFLLLLLIIFLMAALTKSIFFAVKIRALLGALGGILIYYVMSLLDLILIPFCGFERNGIFISLNITSGNYMAAGIYMLLTLLKVAILFCITSYLLERKVNV